MTDFRDALAALARRCGVDLPEDLDDEHRRCALYLAAEPHTDCRQELMAAVALEPDGNVGLGVVLRMLESEDVATREEWLTVLGAGEREYAARRAREMTVLEAHGDVPGLTAELLDSWSDWVQRRLAMVSTHSHVLEMIAEHGRTKRIRGTAAQRHSQRGLER